MSYVRINTGAQWIEPAQMEPASGPGRFRWVHFLKQTFAPFGGSGRQQIACFDTRRPRMATDDADATTCLSCKNAIARMTREMLSGRPEYGG